MNKSIILISSLFIFVITSNCALAETQGNSVPSATVSAPAPAPAPAPLPVLQTTVVKDSQNTPQDSSLQDPSVESFFQIDPTKRNSAQNLLLQPATVTPSTNNKNKSLPYDLYRCVWHVLDNAGVPMFFGQDPYIDPSISKTYLISSPEFPSERAAERENTNAASQNSSPPTATNVPSTTTNTQSINAQPMPQKIPESELEGVTLPVPRDDVHAPAP